MKVLFDQNVPRKLERHLAKHSVTLARALHWERLRNGELLQAAEGLGFECLVTGDRNLGHQQNLQLRKIAIVVLPSGNWPQIQMRLPEIVAAIDRALPNSFYQFPAMSAPG